MQNLISCARYRNNISDFALDLHPRHPMQRNDWFKTKRDNRSSEGEWRANDVTKMVQMRQQLHLTWSSFKSLLFCSFRIYQILWSSQALFTLWGIEIDSLKKRSNRESSRMLSGDIYTI
uniref:Uncharacterized protein n=1 Tax=Glossina austeni TaxID=7395 RepID=A0A1A9V928_GLOAU